MRPHKTDLKLWLIFATLLSFFKLHSAQLLSTYTPFLPSSWPLAVKGPYFNTWGPGGFFPVSGLAFWPQWGDQIRWTCIIIVDNTSYVIMGDVDPPYANQTAVNFTATKTSFSLTAGPVNVNATFLSPITPNDLVRQSLPFSYFYLDILSADGKAHDVRVYSDTTPQWLHGNDASLTDPDPNVSATGSLIASTDFVGLQMQLQTPRPFFEVFDHAQDVIGVFAMKSDPNVKYQIGPDALVRTMGRGSTGLQNTIDTTYSQHSLNDPYDAFALALDLGSIQSTSKSIMWTVGMIRDPSINLTTASGANQLRSSYYWSNFSSIPDIISFVLDDFDGARLSADAFDQMIQNVSLSHVSGYTDLLSLAALQIFGTLEITISKSDDGAWNQSDVMIFSKDMGDVASAGTSGGTNVVDVLYAGFPAMLYLNPNLGQYLLRPILESQMDGGSPIGQAYAPQNLGSQFPNVSSSTLPHNMGIEQSGNMLIMVLACYQKTGDLSIIQDHYPLLKLWADYLVNETLNAGFQSTSLRDGITSFNQTNLVLKGIIGISAMSFISSANSEEEDQILYQKTAQQFMQVWIDGAVSQDLSHLLSSFGDDSSSGLIYNMYADKLLGLGLVPTNITDIQSEYYASTLRANRSSFGVPLDSENPSLSRLDWTMFSIASFLDNASGESPATLQILQPSISMLASYAATRVNNTPLATIYNPENGAAYAGINSFAIGSLFAPLVLEDPSMQKIPMPAKGFPQASTWRIAGPIIGSVSACALLGFGLFAWRWLLRRSSKKPNLDSVPKRPCNVDSRGRPSAERTSEVVDAAVQRLATIRFERYVEDLMFEVQAAAGNRRTFVQGTDDTGTLDQPPSYSDYTSEFTSTVDS
ncbi:hypothetical protein SCHPADRAFT_938384 [Schizopora paradoxa]|uniref:DUF1793-domain-containing protein n=1 Tax=Schizopora paradoxa TaxID=27342 RepID=A0A0H2RVY3_9AGAM|nr:hypothetical protein SCHPADRAFT_938384 [Schizopora paradoxa]